MSAVLEVNGVSKSFGGVRALSECHSARARLDHGLIGPNGSGKTTLFNVITGYERIEQGDVRFDGSEITTRPGQRVRAGLGRTFQLTRMFARLTVLENMLVAIQRKQGWLRAVIHGPVPPRRGGARPSCSSSSGSRVWRAIRLATSRTASESCSSSRRCWCGPGVLLLDEPAGGVNPTLIRHLADRIGDLNKAGKTFLVVEHNMEFVMGLCDRVTVLSQGRP